MQNHCTTGFASILNNALTADAEWLVQAVKIRTYALYVWNNLCVKVEIRVLAISGLMLFQLVPVRLSTEI